MPRAHALQWEATTTRSPCTATGEQIPPATTRENHAQRRRPSTAKINKWMKWTIQWKKKMPSQTKLLKFILIKNYNLFYNRLGVSKFFQLEGQTANNLGFVPRCLGCNSSFAEHKQPQAVCTQMGVAVFPKKRDWQKQAVDQICPIGCSLTTFVLDGKAYQSYTISSRRRKKWKYTFINKINLGKHGTVYDNQFSHSVVSDSLLPHESQHTRPPCPSPTPGVHSNSRPLSRWCHPAISSSVVPSSVPPNWWRYQIFS